MIRKTSEPILEIENLKVEYFTVGGTVCALKGVDLKLDRGGCVGVAGESGSGKSTLALAVLNLIEKNEGKITGGSIDFYEEDGKKIDLASAPPAVLRGIRGNSISLITQDPYTSFNPVMKLGRQMREVYEVHGRSSDGEDFRTRIAELLEAVNLQSPGEILDSYPHQLSGGMLQRASMAAALLNNPRILIADEPTSSLDVTIQKQIILTLKRLRREYNLAVIFITHDLNLLSGIAGKIYILYAGRVVEAAPVKEIFTNPRHPYTIALMEALPALGKDKKITSIPGSPPAPGEIGDGCAFAPRCPVAEGKCYKFPPPFVSSGESGAACFNLK